MTMDESTLFHKPKKIEDGLTHSLNQTPCKSTSTSVLRLSALMDLYIHPLYVLVSKIVSSILNSPAPIYPLYHPLSTISTVGSTYHFI
jgi:hypothetical protein